MVVALVLGGPFGEFLIKHYKIKTPGTQHIDPATTPNATKNIPAADTDNPAAAQLEPHVFDMSILEEEETTDVNGVLKAAGFVFVAVVSVPYLVRTSTPSLPYLLTSVPCS